MATAASLNVRLGMDTAEFTSKLRSAEREAGRWAKSLEDQLMARRFGADEMRLSRLAQSGVGAAQRERIRELIELNALYRDADAPIQRAVQSTNQLTAANQKAEFSMRQLTQVGRLFLGGGYLAVATVALHRIEQFTENIRKVAEAYHDGTRSVAEMNTQLALQVPLFGTLIKIGSNLVATINAISDAEARRGRRGGWAGRAGATDALVDLRTQIQQAQGFIDQGLMSAAELERSSILRRFGDIRGPLSAAMAASGDPDDLRRAQETLDLLDRSLEAQLKAVDVAEEREFIERSISDEKERQKKIDEETDRILKDIVEQEKERERLYEQDLRWAEKTLREWEAIEAEDQKMYDRAREMQEERDRRGVEAPGAVLAGTQAAFSDLARRQLAGIADKDRQRRLDEIKKRADEISTASKAAATTLTRIDGKLAGTAGLN